MCQDCIDHLKTRDQKLINATIKHLPELTEVFDKIMKEGKGIPQKMQANIDAEADQNTKKAMAADIQYSIGVYAAGFACAYLTTSLNPAATLPLFLSGYKDGDATLGAAAAQTKH